ncbi:unnamed protein product [Protopolystoma xenopodis]|uniref:Synergin gamma C-terminal domain-containing protein n=1 Tax=Protopolystoma xenopodis TaxID=117903 RepID=A0A448WW01_9PLAT|nr:unnamed protein product [Protopolystoma xenopodis]
MGLAQAELLVDMPRHLGQANVADFTGESPLPQTDSIPSEDFLFASDARSSHNTASKTIILTTKGNRSENTSSCSNVKISNGGFGGHSQVSGLNSGVPVCQQLCGVCLAPIVAGKTDPGLGTLEELIIRQSSRIQASIELAGHVYHAPCANFWVNRIRFSLPALVPP